MIKVIFPYPQPYGVFPDIYEYVEHLRRFGVDVHYIGWRPRGSRWEFLQQLATKIREANPDLVHVFYFRGCGFLPLLVRKSNIKWIIDVRTIHVENKRLEPERHVWLKTRVTWLESQVFDHILVLTPTIKRYLEPSLRPITLVPLGASAERLRVGATASERQRRREELGLPLESKIILYSGSLSPSRRIDHIISAFAKLVERGFNDAFLLVIGGVRAADSETEKSIIMGLRKLCSELGVHDRVWFTGWLPYTEALELYKVADIGVAYIPKGTPYEFQPPTKLIEYMMAGLLAVGNNVPGISEYIEHERSGILCGNTVDELAQGMEKALQLMERPEILDTIKQEAYRKVEKYDWGSIVRDYVLPVYRQVLE